MQTRFPHILRFPPSIALLIALFTCSPFTAGAAEKPVHQDFLGRITTPEVSRPTHNKKIVIAIVDDGVRGTHAELTEFMWKNPLEIPGNFVDDDGNGVVDDVYGWNVADHNNSVGPPVNRLHEFNHGTHLAGIITQIARKVYGQYAPQHISIMPVKSLSDGAATMAIMRGYEGIEYAIRTGADIILCAWSVAHIAQHEERLLQQASDKGVLIIGSAGNFPEQRKVYPAADRNVFAVAALDRDDNLSKQSNYGAFVDLSAPGDNILSAYSISDNASDIRSGTSQAAAMVAGAAAVMMSQFPDAPIEMIKACLKNSASPLVPDNESFSAKMGAGSLNIGDALACLTADQITNPTTRHPQGYLNLAAAQHEMNSWFIEPPGMFKGIWFTKPPLDDQTGTTIEFYTGSGQEKKLFASYPLESMPTNFFVPSTRVTVMLRGQDQLPTLNNLLLEYRAEAIDFRTLYCSGTSYLSEEGSFDDGSGPEPYAGGSDCKWQITAPEGKAVRFKFTEFDTEPRTDFIYFFNGKGTHEKIMGIFSGHNLPPELTTWTNDVLVWFVTNDTIQGQGWRVEYSFVDNPLIKDQ